MFALDVLGGTIQTTGLGFDEGDADRACVPVPKTLVPSPWMGPSVAQLQVQMLDHDGGPFYGDPRHALGAVLDRYAARGWQPVVAVELEFYLVDVERTAAGHAQPPRSRYTGRRETRTQVNSMADLESVSDILSEITAACEAQGVPTGAALAECGPNQWEVNLRHVADALEACDQAIRFKRIVKGVAHRNGVEATFMAKPYADAPGSGMHLHVSVLDRDGGNVFASDDVLGNDLLKQAAAGLLDDHGRRHGGLRAEREQLPAPAARALRADERDLGLQQPRRRGARAGLRRRRPPPRAPRRRRRRESLPRRGGRARRHAARHRAQARAARPAGRQCLHAAPHGAAPAWRLADGAHAFGESAFLREYFGERFVKLYELTRRGEMQDFNSRLTALDYSWYLEQV